MSDPKLLGSIPETKLDIISRSKHNPLAMYCVLSSLNNLYILTALTMTLPAVPSASPIPGTNETTLGTNINISPLKAEIIILATSKGVPTTGKALNGISIISIISKKTVKIGIFFTQMLLICLIRCYTELAL